MKHPIIKAAIDVRVSDVLPDGSVVVDKGIGLGPRPYVELHYYSPKFKRVIVERFGHGDKVEVKADAMRR